MRRNMPVTQKEYEFEDGLTLLSTTDLQSHILYANPAFIDVSGFSREELDAQPHNVVRHPDMPPQAFADMWRTLKAGKSWTALVKNRRKNGDHYWVRANATPMIREGAVRGFLSVRTRPTREDIRRAEGLYARFREGTMGNRVFRDGLLVRTGILGRLWSSPQLLSVAWRIRLAVALVPLASFVVAAAFNLGPSVTGIVTGTSAAAALLVAWLLEWQIARPLAMIARQAQRVASGCATDNLQLNRIDEIGRILRSINQAGLNLRALVDDVGAQVEGLGSASGEIARGNSELSRRTEASAASVAETAAAVEQLTATVSQNTQASSKSAALAKTASAAMEDGGEAVARVVATMQVIADSSGRISDIVAVIDSIAAQTNLLALNASVEAARAGEQGRGFAVVAGEVRSLAARSADAARQIRELVDANVERVRVGSSLADEAGDTMAGLVQRIREVSSLLDEITRASEEQARGVGQVGVAMEQLDSATQQNAELVERSRESSEDLRRMLRRVADALAVYRDETAGVAPAASAGVEPFPAAGEEKLKAAGG
ncbi:methyl-accepting chemotaxis protein [Parahaliea mediterranea]|uniref:PAS domain-containing protein n=1 Tax=Parahaliea mediterranea TaxID=651086 RepID=A0A939IJT2_9GAMM|nr:PAS domain-containing methyl-accepting chemotaxis protein [Parahaliea mediterranea]MBN7796621.1 PAS domain-containing protein [Parahaliea mediterranea]